MTRKHRIHALNHIALPAAFQRELLADCIQESVNSLLEKDRRFEKNQRQLRSQFTTGAIDHSRFKAIRDWQIGDVIRRAGLPLVVTRAYLRVTASADA